MLSKIEDVLELLVSIGMIAGLILLALMATPFFWLGIIACILLVKM
jgi:hypothetical protein